MEWYHKLYVGDSLVDKADEIKWKINHNAGTVMVYVIALASNRQNLLDIIPSWELMKKSYPKKELKIVGLARGYREALEVTRRIVDDTYRNSGDVNVRAFLKEKGRRDI